MRTITVVTGPLRSGTSCTTGLLEKCGFDLGKTVRILRNQTEHNPRGHFEPDLLVTINQQLLFEAGERVYGFFSLPSEAELSKLVNERERYFRLFIKKFDGELCKDPLLCIMLSAWKKYWPELQRVVFCLRHPLAVAASMHKRYGLALEEGLSAWQRYTRRFLHVVKGIDSYIFDFDRFCSDPAPVFTDLLNWLGRPLEQNILQGHLHDFLVPPRSIIDQNQWDHVQPEIRNLYYDLKMDPENAKEYYSDKL